MFYCDECAKKNKYPLTAFRSYGICNLCKKLRDCNDKASKNLPTTVDLSREDCLSQLEIWIVTCKRDAKESFASCKECPSRGNCRRAKAKIRKLIKLTPEQALAQEIISKHPEAAKELIKRKVSREFIEKIIDIIIEPLDDYDIPEEQRLYMQITDEQRGELIKLFKEELDIEEED